VSSLSQNRQGIPAADVHLSSSHEVGAEIPGRPRLQASLEAGIEVTCVYCYITCHAVFQIEVPDSSEMDTFWASTLDAIQDAIGDLVETGQELMFQDEDINGTNSHALDDVASVTLPQPPSVSLRVELRDLDLYAELQTIISGQATLSLTLYRSQTPIGIWLDENNEIGAFFTIDLLLSAEADIKINSGFHIKLDDGVSFNLALFSEDISSLEM
jgi:hypothetical protein